METDRIILRPWRDSDAEVLYRWASDPDVGPRAGWAPHKSVEESLEIIRTVFNDAFHTWAIELKATGEAIGAMGYGPSCECNLPVREGEPLIGYWVAKPYWNQGICTEALRLMLDHIRETTDIQSLISGHFVDNPASGRVMEKCGFVPTGETCIDANQYQGANRPIRVLRLEIKRMRYREEAIECVKDHVLQIHKQIYAKYEGDFDRIYTEGYNSKSYTGRVIEPGKIYELSYLECTCPKVKCGLRNHPQQCECSRQSILYILSQLEPDSQFDVRIENTILRGSDRCTFRITKL
jgi:RimJ/RimL family protein N-acetyltransferase